MNDEEYVAHPVWQALSEARSSLENMGLESRSEETSGVSDLIRVIGIAETAKNVAAVLVDSEAISQLKNIADKVTNAATTAIRESIDPAEELDDSKNEFIDVLKLLPINSADPELVEKYEQSMSNFVSNISLVTYRINELEDEAKQQVQEFQGRISKSHADIQAALGDANVELKTRLESIHEQLSAIKSDIDSQKLRLDAALNDFSTNSQAKISQKEEEFKALSQQLEKEFSDQKSQLNDEANDLLFKMEEYKNQATLLVDATARGTISAEYGERAKEERKAAFWWSFAAVAIAILGLASISMGMANIQAMSPSETIWKSTTTLVLLAIAGYMGKEAAAHRKEERDAKRAQLDLNAFNPFLTLMDDEDARELRKEFAHRIFNRPLANLKSESGFGLPTSLSRRGKATDEQDE